MGKEANSWMGVYLTLGVLTILSSCSVLICLANVPELLKRSFHRLLFFLFISDVLVGISCCIWFSGGLASGPRCSAFFFLFYTFRNMSVLVNTLMFFGLWSLVTFHKAIHKSIEIYLVAMSFLLPLVLVIADMCLSPLESRYYLVDDVHQTDDFVVQGACFISDTKGDAWRIGLVLYNWIPLLSSIFMLLMGFHVMYRTHKEVGEVRKMYIKAHRRIKYYLLNFVVFNFVVSAGQTNDHNLTFQGLVVFIPIINAGIFYCMNKKVVRKAMKRIKQMYLAGAQKNSNVLGGQSDSLNKRITLRHALFHEQYDHNDASSEDDDDVILRSSGSNVTIEITEPSISPMESRVSVSTTGDVDVNASTKENTTKIYDT